MSNFKIENGILYVQVFTRFITIKGKRRYKPDGGLYVFWAKVDKVAKQKAA
jgi:hypothetical protein